MEDRPLPTIGHYEVVRGLTGVGRYLLARAESCEEPLTAVLDYLVRLSLGTVEHQGADVPRWWALDAPRIGSEAAFPGGHLNLGLSHGVAGPLALLALAWEQGVRVPRQREAMEATAALLRTWAVADRYGLFWPGYLSFAQWQRGPAAYDGTAKWPAWCYGAPGVSRALQLAGRALGRADFSDLARASVERLLVLPGRPGASTTTPCATVGPGRCTSSAGSTRGGRTRGWPNCGTASPPTSSPPSTLNCRSDCASR